MSTNDPPFLDTASANTHLAVSHLQLPPCYWSRVDWSIKCVDFCGMVSPCCCHCIKPAAQSNSDKVLVWSHQLQCDWQCYLSDYLKAVIKYQQWLHYNNRIFKLVFCLWVLLQFLSFSVGFPKSDTDLGFLDVCGLSVYNRSQCKRSSVKRHTLYD